MAIALFIFPNIRSISPRLLRRSSPYSIAVFRFLRLGITGTLPLDPKKRRNLSLSCPRSPSAWQPRASSTSSGAAFTPAAAAPASQKTARQMPVASHRQAHLRTCPCQRRRLAVCTVSRRRPRSASPQVEPSRQKRHEYRGGQHCDFSRAPTTSSARLGSSAACRFPIYGRDFGFSHLQFV